MFQSFFTAGLLIVNQLLEHAGDLGDSRTNRIGATGELRASHRFSAGQIVRQQHGTAANQNGIDGITGNLHGVNGVLHHLSHRCICLIGNFLADACGQRGIANVRLAKTIGNIGGGHHIAAEAKRLFGDLVSHRIGAYSDRAVIMRAHYGTAAQPDGDNIRHTEVGTYATDVNGDTALAGESVRQYTEVGSGTAHINHNRIITASQVAGTTNGVCGATCDGENRITPCIIKGHQSAVILGEVYLSVDDALVFQALRKAIGKSFGHFRQRGVEDGGVFALDQTHGADFAGNGYWEILAKNLMGDLRRTHLVIVAHGGEHAGDGQGFDLALYFVEKCAAGFLVELVETLAVELETAADDHPVDAHSPNGILPIHHRRNALGGRCANTQDGDWGHNTAVYIFGCVLFHGSHHVHALINQHGIGVRSTDINS